MTTSLATEERAIEESGARLAVYRLVLERVAEAIRTNREDAFKTVRDNVTRWAPSTVSLPIWEILYDGLRDEEKRASLNEKIIESIAAINDILHQRRRELSAELLGNVAHDINVFLSKAS